MKVGDYQERLSGNNAQVWWAICLSSCEARTSTKQRDAGSLIGLFADLFRASSRLTPIQANPPQISARTFTSCSPIPPYQRIHPIECGDHGPATCRSRKSHPRGFAR